jgi:hypothetical protein
MQNDIFRGPPADKAVKPVVFSDLDKTEPANPDSAHQAVVDISFSAPISATPAR